MGMEEVRIMSLLHALKSSFLHEMKDRFKYFLSFS